jgi:proton-dependent oligopeptide transporter, POT family
MTNVRRPKSAAADDCPPFPGSCPERAQSLGQPRGLAILAATEFWERVSFHGMQALLVLFMVDQLLLPGHVEHIIGFRQFRSAIEAVTGPLSVQALASQIFGLYVGLIYFTPTLGGLLGDRLVGRCGGVCIGGLLMAAGHFCMAFERPFLLALLLLIIGAGCLRGNLLAQVGSLYANDDRRRADGFQIYVAVLNTGALFAPLISGTLAQVYGWHIGFAFAGFGMLVGLLVYLIGQPYMPAEVSLETRRKRMLLNPAERRIALYLLMMLPMLALFWVGQAQIWNTYNIWARDHLELRVGSWTIPVPWLQTFEGIGAVGMMPVVVWLWRQQAALGSEPDEFTKISVGCLVYATMLVWLACSGLVVDPNGKVPLPWIIVFHILSQVGYLYVSPVAVALFSRAAPPTLSATMVSVYYVSAFAGSTVSGRLGGLYERLSPMRFWLVHAGIVYCGGLLVMICAPRLRRELAGRLR